MYITLPNERANALYNALRFMQDLLDPKKTPRVPKVVRKQAYWALRHYPRGYELDRICEEASNLEPPIGVKEDLRRELRDKTLDDYANDTKKGTI